MFYSSFVRNKLTFGIQNIILGSLKAKNSPFDIPSWLGKLNKKDAAKKIQKAPQ